MFLTGSVMKHTTPGLMIEFHLNLCICSVSTVDWMGEIASSAIPIALQQESPNNFSISFTSPGRRCSLMACLGILNKHKINIRVEYYKRNVLRNVWYNSNHLKKTFIKYEAIKFELLPISFWYHSFLLYLPSAYTFFT